MMNRFAARLRLYELFWTSEQADSIVFVTKKSRQGESSQMVWLVKKRRRRRQRDYAMRLWGASNAIHGALSPPVARSFLLAGLCVRPAGRPSCLCACVCVCFPRRPAPVLCSCSSVHLCRARTENGSRPLSGSRASPGFGAPRPPPAHLFFGVPLLDVDLLAFFTAI